MEIMGHYLFNYKLSTKLNILFYSSINSEIKINNDPIPYLLSDDSEIKNFYGWKYFTKILYFNMKSIHRLLYQFDLIIRIDDNAPNDLSFNYYLILLIKDEPEIINYEFSINYIKIFNKLKNNEQNKYFNIFNSKITIELLNNLKNGDLFNENKDGDYASKLEIENIEYIKNYLNIFKEINLDLNENDIINKNIDELYIDIIISLIKSCKLSNFDFTNNIFKQLDLENIEISFMESEYLFQRINEALYMNNDYIKNYIIYNSKDFYNIKKINFYYMLLKYILKDPLYIYHIPLLFNTHKNIIEILKSREIFDFSISEPIIIERVEYVIKKISDSGYYFNSKYLSKKKVSFVNEKQINIKLRLLKFSKFIFDISIKVDKNPKINKIECIYDKDKQISFEEILKLYDEKNYIENKSELNTNYHLLLNSLNTYKKIIESKTSIFKFDYNFKILLELSNTNRKNNNIYSINAKYSVIEHPFLTTNLYSSDNNILEKTEGELEGFNSLMSKLNLQTETNQSSIKETTKISSKVDKKKRVEIMEPFIIENNDNEEKGVFVPSQYKIIQYEKIIYEHEIPVKFFLCLRDGYYFSCGNGKNMILYDNEFNQILNINNLDIILYHISEKAPKDKNFIELIASYGNYIFLITIDKINKEYDVKKYEIPNTNVMFCIQILKNFVIGGIGKVIQVEELFNKKIEIKSNKKISKKSFKSGLLLDDNYIALVSYDLLTKGSNELVICNLTTNIIEFSISDFSFNFSDNSLCLMRLTNGNKLLCACKKYKKNEENGILLIDLNYSHNDKFRYEFFKTGNIEIYCFCQIFEKSNFFLVGCFNLDARVNLVKLFKLKEGKELGIRYLQDIENIDDKFRGFELPVNNIVQLKDSGKIVITTLDGKIYLFSKPNLDLYLEE